MASNRLPRSQTPAIEVELNAVIVAVAEEDPRIVTVHGAPQRALSTIALEGLPSGSLDPAGDRTLGLGMRRWVHEQTGIDLGYIEQLYTFGDRDRAPGLDRRVLTIAYLGLVRDRPVEGSGEPAWRRIYDYLPWEDWRDGRPGLIDGEITPALFEWARTAGDEAVRARRIERIEISFGIGAASFDPVRALDRYELMYEAGLVAESAPVGSAAGHGRPMALDHRRIVASALERIRGKLSYRPVVFELVPEAFTLNQLQRVVEALTGQRLHKPNFRRLVEQGQLVERTGALEPRTGGRPAELFRFRRDVVRARPTLGVGLPRRMARSGREPSA